MIDSPHRSTRTFESPRRRVAL